MVRLWRAGFTGAATGHAAVMDLKRPLVVLAAIVLYRPEGSIVQVVRDDLDRGEGECNAAEAGGSEQQLCEDTETDNEQQTDEEDDGVS